MEKNSDELLNSFVNLVFELITMVVDCENLGIRIKNEVDDYGFYRLKNLPEEFNHGLKIPCDESVADRPENLSCLCGAVIENSNFYFQKHCSDFGSYYSNQFQTDFLKLKQYFTYLNDQCYRMGVQSIALIPLKERIDRFGFGLLYLSDREDKNISDLHIGKLEDIAIYFAKILFLIKKMNPHGNKKHRIVIVDDEKSICLMLCKVLTHYGYECKSFSEKDTAFEYISTNRIDLVVVDIKMQRESGLDLIRSLRDRFGVYSPKVMVLSGSINQEDSNALNKISNIVIMQKPIDNLQEFPVLVEKALLEDYEYYGSNGLA